MKISELKEVLKSARDNAEIKIVDGEVVVVEPTPVTDRFIAGKDCPAYKLDDCENVEEDKLELYVSRDITERIKTFGDACQWCKENGLPYLVDVHDDVCDKLADCFEFAWRDLLAYLKLRIITTALNEGWEPTFEDGETRWYICADEDYGGPSICSSDGVITLTESSKLLFKNDKLAEYAAVHFKDIYTDFCGCNKGDGV